MKHPTFPLSSPRATARRWIGAVCVLLLVAALVLLAIWSGGWFQEREEYRLRLSGATELTKGSPVLLLGQPVGRVAAVKIVAEADQPLVEVRFWIEGAHLGWMREGTTVTADATLVGSPWLELSPGPSGSRPLAAGSVLEGQVGQGMMDKLLELLPVVEGLITQIDTLVGTLNTSVRRLDPILAQVETQLGTTQEALTEITGLIGTTRELFEQVKTEQTVLVDGVATTLARVNDELLPGLEKLLAESRGMVGESFGELDETLEILQERLPAFLAVTQETLENTRDITEAAKNTWPFRGYWKRKAKEEAEAARRAAARDGS